MKKQKKSLLKLAVQALLIVTVIMFISAGVRIRNYSHGYAYNYSARDYVYDIENNRYGDAYYTAIDHMGRDVSYDEDESEFRALAFYFEEAVLEKAYREDGQTEKAEAFEAKKEEYRNELGSLSSKAKAVDELLDKFD